MYTFCNEETEKKGSKWQEIIEKKGGKKEKRRAGKEVMTEEIIRELMTNNVRDDEKEGKP